MHLGGAGARGEVHGGQSRPVTVLGSAGAHDRALDEAAIGDGSPVARHGNRLVDRPDGPTTSPSRRLAEGHSNLTYVVRCRRACSWSCAARRPGRCCRPRTTSCASTASWTCSRAPTRRCACRAYVAVCEDAGRARRAVLPDGTGRSASSSATSCRPGWTAAGQRRPRARPGGRARRDPPRRPSSRSSPPGSAAPGGYLERQLRRWTGPARGHPGRGRRSRRTGARRCPTTTPCATGCATTCPTSSSRRSCTATTSWTTSWSAPGTRPRASPRSSTGRWRPSATRGPTWATCCRSGRSQGERCTRWATSSRPARASPPAPSWSRSGSRPPADRPGTPRWFVTLAVWKLAVLLEASYHRHLAGTHRRPVLRHARARRARPARPCPRGLRCLSCGRCSSTGAAC